MGHRIAFIRKNLLEAELEHGIARTKTYLIRKSVVFSKHRKKGFKRTA